MPHRHLIFCLLALALGMPPDCASGQPPPSRDPVMIGWGGHSGVEECCDCHYGGSLNPLRNVSGKVSQLDEARTWLQHDKHAIARQRIEPLRSTEITNARQRMQAALGDRADVEQWIGPSNELSRLICERLGWDVDADDGYQKFREQCLTCHGGYAEGTDSRAFSRSENRQPGISCTACHQVGSRTSWVQEHRTSDRWRLLSLDQKSAAGMRPLKSELGQADLCVDCHVGNLAQQKFVTHAMYAAGHPPLPDFELQTFCQQMPQHWLDPPQRFAELAGFQGRETYFQLNYEPMVPKRRGSTEDFAQVGWRTRKVLIGGVAARRQWLELISAAAQAELWGDYALYDCMACHHDVHGNRARQEFALPAVPGRPRQPLWPLVLGRIAARQTSLAGEMEAAEQELLTALDREPFGDRVACAEAAQKLLGQIDRLQQEISANPFDTAGRTAVLLELAETPAASLVDYLSARQVVWAIQQVGQEVPGFHVARSGADAEIWHGVGTRLPAGRTRSIFPQFLDEELKRRAQYDPHDLIAALNQIRQTIRGEQASE